VPGIALLAGCDASASPVRIRAALRVCHEAGASPRRLSRAVVAAAILRRTSLPGWRGVAAKPPGEGRLSRRRGRAYASAATPSKIGGNKSAPGFTGAQFSASPPSAANFCAPFLYGNYLLIHGEGERYSYFYAHMPRPALVRKGERVWEGERVGAVGETGNAIGVGCHLHFEIHVHGVPVDPEPDLRRWDRYS